MLLRVCSTLLAFCQANADMGDTVLLVDASILNLDGRRKAACITRSTRGRRKAQYRLALSRLSIASLCERRIGKVGNV